MTEYTFDAPEPLQLHVENGSGHIERVLEVPSEHGSDVR